jgi:hypothetical protein
VKEDSPAIPVKLRLPQFSKIAEAISLASADEATAW